MSVIYLLKSSFINIFERLTERRVIKFITLSAITVYWTSFISSFILIGFFGNNGYSPFSNLISDMGSSQYSPIPIIFDLGCIIPGLLSFPISFYIYRYLRENGNPETNSYFFYKAILLFMLVSGIIGDVGFVGIGIYSVDRNPYNIHHLFASFLFVGYFISTFLTGILTVFFKIKINRMIGKLGLFLSSIIFVFYIILVISNIDFVFFEWIANFSLLIWLYTFLFSILKK